MVDNLRHPEDPDDETKAKLYESGENLGQHRTHRPGPAGLDCALTSLIAIFAKMDVNATNTAESVAYTSHTIE